MRRAASSPSREVLAAIAAAYRIAFAHAAPATPPASRWRLAARIDVRDASQARAVAHAASRWNAAGRVDD